MFSKIWKCIARPAFSSQPMPSAATAPHDQPTLNVQKPNPPVESVRSRSTQSMHAGKLLMASAHDVARSRLEVQTMCEEAVLVYQQAWGSKHTLTIDAVTTLGLFYAGQDRTSNAETLLKRAVDGREGSYGVEHPLSLDAANDLAHLYQRSGRLNEAEVWYRKALQGYTKTLGKEHVETLDTASSLADLYLRQGRLEHAEKLYERVLRIKEKTLGPNSISMLKAVNNLGYLYASQGRLVNAEATYQRALRGYEVAFGRQHTTTLEIIHNLGFIYQIQGRLTDAEAMYMRALYGYEKFLGKTRLATYAPASITVECLANLLYEQNRVEESRYYMLCAASGPDVIHGQIRQRCENGFTTISRFSKGVLIHETQTPCSCSTDKQTTISSAT